eukprot:255380-Amphidinium_carterae.1
MSNPEVKIGNDWGESEVLLKSVALQSCTHESECSFPRSCEHAETLRQRRQDGGACQLRTIASKYTANCLSQNGCFDPLALKCC